MEIVLMGSSVAVSEDLGVPRMKTDEGFVLPTKTWFTSPSSSLSFDNPTSQLIKS
jgi:hypothetical protein